MLARDDYRCVRCGGPATNVHHVIGRGMGGSRDARVKSPAVQVSLCGMGNTGGCHGWAEANRDGEATRLGYRLSRAVLGDPAWSPEGHRVWAYRRGWVALTGDGRVTRAA